MTEELKLVSATELALERAKKLKSDNPEWHGKDLRIYLSGKNCDGFEYGVAFDNRENRDHLINFGDLALVIDPDTLEFCSGSTLDWVDDDRGQGFVVNNPNHRKFRGKFYKKKEWQEKLMQKRTN